MGGLWDFSDSPEAKLPFPLGFDWNFDWGLSIVFAHVCFVASACYRFWKALNWEWICVSRIIEISKRTMNINTLFQGLLCIKFSILPVFCAPMQIPSVLGPSPLYYNCTNTVDSNDDESLWTALQEVNRKNMIKMITRCNYKGHDFNFLFNISIKHFNSTL